MWPRPLRWQALITPSQVRPKLALQLAGTRAHPQGHGHIHAANASAYGEPIERFDADLQLGTDETALTNINLTHEGGEVTGNAAYSPAKRAFRLDLLGKNFDVSRIRQIQLPRLPIEGRADFTLQGNGTLEAPVINAHVRARDVAFAGELAGAMDLEATTSNGQMQLKGSSEFSRGTLAAGRNGRHARRLSRENLRPNGQPGCRSSMARLSGPAAYRAFGSRWNRDHGRSAPVSVRDGR